METTFHLNADELDSKFVKAVKALFTGQNLVISVATEMDTTDYLLSDPERKERLLQSMQQVKDGNLVNVSLDDYRTP